MELTTITTPRNPVLLQRLVSQDITVAKPMLSCICNHFGKVESRFWVHSDQNHTYLHIEPEGLKTLQACIQKYDIHAETTLSNLSNTPVEQLGFEADIPWPLQLIQKQIIYITPEIQAKYTPHVLGLINHNAVSFNKGCFIGHEPIARTHFKGRVKKQVLYKSAPQKSINALNHYFDGTTYHMLVLTSVVA